MTISAINRTIAENDVNISNEKLFLRFYEVIKCGPAYKLLYTSFCSRARGFRWLRESVVVANNFYSRRLYFAVFFLKTCLRQRMFATNLSPDPSCYNNHVTCGEKYSRRRCSRGAGEGFSHANKSWLTVIYDKAVWAVLDLITPDRV